jgi:hypothetical protein
LKFRDSPSRKQRRTGRIRRIGNKLRHERVRRRREREPVRYMFALCSNQAPSHASPQVSDPVATGWRLRVGRRRCADGLNRSRGNWWQDVE